MNRFLMLIIAFLTLHSCATQKEVAYFQDVQPGREIGMDMGTDITVRPDDMISIVVSSKNPQLAMLFNLPRIQQVAGAEEVATALNNTNGNLSGYTIDSEGYIDFPVIGKIHIAGLTREQIAQEIKTILIDSNQLKDAIVTVEFLNLRFTILGEVKTPGIINITRNQTTIIEAIGMAGDLTIYGERSKVFLTRQQDGKRVTYQLDLRSQNLYQSPAYFVQQGDFIYVEPNKTRTNQSTSVGNTLQNPSFWLSVATALTTIAVLFTN